MKLILARHCETEWNRLGKLQGQIDIELNARGLVEAEELAEKLKTLDTTISRIVSSDLKRAQKTAEIISSRLGVPFLVDKRLRECHFGTLEGMSKEELMKIYPEEMRPALFTNKNSPAVWHGSYEEYDFSKFGGEERKKVFARHLSLMEELPKEERGATLLIGHGTSLNTLLAGLKYEPGLSRGEFRLIEYSV